MSLPPQTRSLPALKPMLQRTLPRASSDHSPPPGGRVSVTSGMALPRARLCLSNLEHSRWTQGPHMSYPNGPELLLEPSLDSASGPSLTRDSQKAVICGRRKQGKTLGWRWGHIMPERPPTMQDRMRLRREGVGLVGSLSISSFWHKCQRIQNS